MDTIIDDYARSVRALTCVKEEYESKLEQLRGARERHMKERAALRWWQRLTTWFSHQKTLFKICAMEDTIQSQWAYARRNRIEEQKAALNALMDRVFAPCAKDLIERERDYFAVEALREANAELIKLGHAALQSIDKAKSDVSDAQFMELVDFGTKSKGFAMMSTFSTMGASDSVKEASQAVQDFVEALEDDQDRIERLGHDVSLEIVDLCLDLTGLTSSFDFGSLLSLFSLSSTEGSLREAHRQVGALLEPLRSTERRLEQACQRDHDALQQAKRLAFAPAIDRIQALGAPVPSDDLLSEVIDQHRFQTAESGSRAGYECLACDVPQSAGAN